MFHRIQFGKLVFNQFLPEKTQQAFEKDEKLKELVEQFEDARKDVLVLGHSKEGTFQSIFVAPIADYGDLIPKFESDAATTIMEYGFKDGKFSDINYIGDTASEDDTSLPAQITRTIEHLTQYKSNIIAAVENLTGYFMSTYFTQAK